MIIDLVRDEASRPRIESCMKAYAAEFGEPCGEVVAMSPTHVFFPFGSSSWRRKMPMGLLYLGQVVCLSRPRPNPALGDQVILWSEPSIWALRAELRTRRRPTTNIVSVFSGLDRAVKLGDINFGTRDEADALAQILKRP